MDIREVLEYLDKDALFKGWRAKNKDDYFSYAFKLLMDGRDTDWQIGFYCKEKESITTFVIENNKISIRKDEEVFRRDESHVRPIQMNAVTVPLEKILQSAQNYRAEKYPTEIPIKAIVILQNLPEFGNVWNVTYITAQFNTINFKLNAKSGVVVDEKKDSLLSFGTVENGRQKV